MIKKAQEGSLKALYVMGENPMLSDPDIHHVEKALKNLELLVVQDIFLTETAELAHVLLPACSFAEKDGTVTNSERRVQRVRKVIEPVGSSKADWLIIQEIAKTCGYPMNYTHPKEIMDEIADVTPSYGGMQYSRLEEGWGLLWPCPNKDHPGIPVLHKDKFTKGLGTFFPRPYIKPDEMPDAEYDFVLTTGRMYFHYHTGSMTRRMEVLEREAPQCYVEMNPKDAQSLKVKTGMKVNVSSRRGSVEVAVLVTDKVAEKVIFIPFHFKEAAANLLTNPACDPVASIPEYKVCAVKVRRS
jgi:predicted molibdopterin-dependent oxidoreductase YjgC